MDDGPWACQIGAFETTAAGCVAVGYPKDPDPPLVAISAPDAIGHCDDLTVEGSATVAFIGRRLILEFQQCETPIVYEGAKQ